MEIRSVSDPAVWTVAEIKGKEGFVRRLEPAHLDGLSELLSRCEGVPLERITRQEFDQPAVSALMADVRRDLFQGHGAAVVSGIDLDHFGGESFERICWGLGTHLGNAAPQSYRRDRLGYVQKEEHNPTARGYLMDVELRSHTDFHEVLCLACVRRAPTGGESGLVSSLAVHNAILESRPEILSALYEGFYQEWAGAQMVSTEKIPIFCRVGDKVSCYYHPLAILNGAKALGVPVPPELAEGLQVFREVADGPRLRADFMLEPGEIMFWHNFLVLHSRKAFQDSASQKRRLLRLWLNVPGGRAMHPAFTGRARAMDFEHERGRPAIDYTKYGTFNPTPVPVGKPA